MTETATAPRAKHTPEEIRQNHLNAAVRSFNAANKRVAAVTLKRENIKLQAATIDSEYASVDAVLRGAQERYRHAYLVAKGEQPTEWPDGTTVAPQMDEGDDTEEGEEENRRDWTGE